MPIKLNQMHKYIGYRDDEAIDVLTDFIVDLTKQFFASPEGKAHLINYPESDGYGSGYWIDNLLEFGYVHEGAVLPHMTPRDVNVILSSILPRKITLRTRQEAENAIPELQAFWRYLKREYGLKQSDAVLSVLDNLEPKFVDMIFDPSRAGMAKSMLMTGVEAGYSMSTPEEINEYIALYGIQQLAEIEEESSSPGTIFGFESLPAPSPRRAAPKEKKSKRKMAKASSKKNRKKKR